MRGKKGALDVSINSIVVVIFAIVMLGLGIAFINGMFTPLQEKINIPDVDLPSADASNPISMFDFSNNRAVPRGKSAEFTIKVYNNMNTDITVTDKPKIMECSPNSVSNLFGGQAPYPLITTGQRVPVGQEASYKVIMQIKSNAPLGKNVCTLQISATPASGTADTETKQFSLEIKSS